MNIFGRKTLDPDRPISLDRVDDVVFQINGAEFVVSLRRARSTGRVEVRCNTGVLVVYPEAANVVSCEAGD